MQICLVRLWWIGFSAIATTDLLSQNSSIPSFCFSPKSLNILLNQITWGNKKPKHILLRSRIAYRFVASLKTRKQPAFKRKHTTGGPFHVIFATTLIIIIIANSFSIQFDAIVYTPLDVSEHHFCSAKVNMTMTVTMHEAESKLIENIISSLVAVQQNKFLYKLLYSVVSTSHI